MKKPRIYSLGGNVFSVEIPYKEQGKLKDERVKKAVSKAVKALEADKLIFTKELSKWDNCIKGDVFYKLAPKGVEAVLNRFNMAAPVSLAVRAKKADERVFHLIKKLIFRAKNIKILTAENENGVRLCDALMREFGEIGQIFPYDYVQRGGITVDLDKESICLFGKAELCGFEIEGEDYGYNIDLTQLLWARNGDFDKIVIKSCYCGKNKLTLKGF